MNILLVEDDDRVIEFLVRGLKAEGYDVDVCRDGPSGLEHGKSRTCDLIILDLMLPGMHGFEVCQNLRMAGANTPLLMLTAMDEVEHRVRGLRLGADDYLTKPFVFSELLARIDALMRRSGAAVPKAAKIEMSGLTFDRETLQVHRDGMEISLTAKEMALLELMLSAPGKVFSRTSILENVWGYSSEPMTNVVDVYISRLRGKVDANFAKPLIKTVRGFGYKIDEENSEHDT